MGFTHEIRIQIRFGISKCIGEYGNFLSISILLKQFLLKCITFSKVETNKRAY